MSVSDINYRLKNNLSIEVVFPEFVPNYSFNINKYYSSEMQLNLDVNFTDEFCNIKPHMDNTLIDGLHWTALANPFTSKQKLENLGKLSTVFFYLDDSVAYNFGDVGRSAEKAKSFAEMCCMLIDNIEDIRKIPIKEIQTWKPFMFALYSTMYAIREESSSSLWKRLTDAFKEYLMSYINECKIDDESYFVDEPKLLEFRLKNSCGYPFLYSILYADCIELTEEELSDDLLQNVLHYAIKSLIMCNDLYSFRKELKECNGMLEKSMNMIAVVMRTQNLTLQEAFDKQVSIIKNMDVLHEKAKQSLFDSSPSEEVKRFCRSIDYLIGGNWIFHLMAKRYHGPDFKGCIPSNGKLIYSPNETIIIPANTGDNKFEKFRKYNRF